MKTTFEYKGANSAGRIAYAEMIRNQFFAGSAMPASANNMELKVEGSSTKLVSVWHTQSNVELRYRRSRRDIQRNPARLRTIWLIRKGVLTCTRTEGSFSANEGWCVVNDPDHEYYACAQPDCKGLFDAIQVLVPAHLTTSHLRVGLHSPFLLAPDTQTHIDNLLQLMLDLDDRSAADAVGPLSVGLLHLLSAYKIQPEVRSSSVTSLIDRHHQDIISCISKNLTNPTLTYHRVAKMCGISPRHLCHVLKSKNVRYAEIVWGQRLQQAREWLTDPIFAQRGVQEIAYMAGFKSPNHFSRAFKAAYGLTPRSCRESRLQ